MQSMTKLRGRFVWAAVAGLAALGAGAAYGDTVTTVVGTLNLPIPGALLLFGSALVGLGAFSARRRKSGPAA